MRRVRRERRCGQGIGQGGRHRCVVARRLRRQAQAAARRMDDGAGGRGRADGRGFVEPIPARRHHRRRRQLLLHRRHPSRRNARGQGDSLCRFGYQRRRVGTRARLLPDDWRRAASDQTSRFNFRHARAADRFRPAHCRAARRSRAAPPSTATCIAAPTAPATSSRWFTTESSTGSWRRTRKG